MFGDGGVGYMGGLVKISGASSLVAKALKERGEEAR